MVDKDRVFPRITTWDRWLEEWHKPGLSEPAAAGLIMSIGYVAFREAERAVAAQTFQEISAAYQKTSPVVSAAASQMMRSMKAA